jgi:exosortase E/protease (VPEID-CTERM system)
MSLVDLDHVEPIPQLTPLLSVRRKLPDHLLGRVYLFVAILLAEYAAIVSVPHPWCSLHQAVAGAIVFLGVFLFVAAPSLQSDRTPIELRLPMLALYGVSLGVIALAHGVLLLTSWSRTPFIILWFAAIPFSALALLCALIPIRVLPSLLRRTRLAWIYASVAAALAVSLAEVVSNMWDAPQSWGSLFLQRTTFVLVGRVLQLFYPTVHTDPSTYTIFLPYFNVTVEAYCSGIEGLSLTLLFTLGWLWYARRQLRFPRALLLVPSAMSVIWMLNILRIVGLLAIGNAGYQQVAEHGFHSEAGWIAFNLVALGFLAVANSSPWLAREGFDGNEHRSASLSANVARNVASIYLLPFLAILGAGLVSKATSSGFEWAYPLRFIAAAAVLWHYRAEYRRIDWSFGWAGPVVGTLVFVMWLGLSRWASGIAINDIGRSLAVMPALERAGWLIVRVAAAVITVPVAEELAFRGFLLRRVSSADVESVSYRTVTALAILISSVAFGVMHGKLWFAGVIAGIGYSLLAKWKGRLGEAVAAHMTTNLLLAVWVIARGDWGLW